MTAGSEPSELPATYLAGMAAVLIRSFAGIFPQEDVEHIVWDSYRLLADLRSGAVEPGAVEGLARDRLLALGRIEGMILADVPSVIFVCVHNAGRSQMSAGWARHLGGGRLVVFSGGSAPGEAVNPLAVTAMAEVGVDISDGFPKPFTDETVRAADVVVTMGCGDACPYFPGKRYLDWELEDPHRATLERVRLVRDEIGVLVRGLLGELGVI